MLAVGHVDGIDDEGCLFGWASTGVAGVIARLRVDVDGVAIDEIAADQFREDLCRGEFPNAACAYWYAIPAAYRDGREHQINLSLISTGQPLRNSPYRFRLDDHDVAVCPRGANLIPNAGFDRWPSGLRVAVEKRLTEFCAGWLFDFRAGAQPSIVCSADRCDDLALLPGHYALRVELDDAGRDSRARIIVPLPLDRPALHDLRFSLGLRRPSHAAPDALHVREIFVGALAETRLRKVGSVRKMLAPQGTQRLLGLPLGAAGGDLAIEPHEHAVLALDLAGSGVITLFAPELDTAPPAPREPNAVIGGFEDPCIAEQAAFLTLGAIWTAPVAAVGGDAARPAEPVHPITAARGHLGVPFVQIVVPVFNAAIHVEDLLRSIQACTLSPHEVLVFDDGSDDYTRERIARWEAIDPRIRYHRQPRNLGYTRNVNIAVQSTVADHIVVINSDTIVTPGWLTKLYHALASDGRTAAAGPLSNAASWQSIPRTRTPSGDWMLNLLPEGVGPAELAALVDRFSTASYPEFPLLNGFCTLFRRHALEQCGFYDDQSFPEGYGEENDLCLRLGQQGFTLRVADDAYVHHKKSVSFGAARRKSLSRRANTILRAKHPETDIAAVEERMRTEPTLIALRSQLLRALAVEPVAP